MSNLYTVQEEDLNQNDYLYNQNNFNDTELHPEQNYYQLKSSNNNSPQRVVKSRIDDVTMSINQYSPNKNQKVKQSLSPQKNQLNSFDRSQIENGIFQKQTYQQQSNNHNPLQIVNTQARRIEELQIEVELLKQRENIQLSTEEKNQLISDLYSQIEQKNKQLIKQNEIISSLERQVLDGNAKLRILEIDTEQYMIEMKQYKDELMLQNARNQSLQSNIHEIRKMLDETQTEKTQMNDQFRKQYQDAVEENLALKNTINEMQDKNNQIANQLNTALDQIIAEKASSEMLKVQLSQLQKSQQLAQSTQIPQAQQQGHNQLRRDSMADDTLYNASYNNQSFLLDDFNANTINISMTSENLSEKMKRYCSELDSFIEKFLENKKYRVRSKQEMKFFSEMAKMIQFLKNKHLKISDEFKEQVDAMNKKSDETRAHMISTLAHVRILKQSTEITITDLEKTIDGLKKDRERNLKNIEELLQKKKESEKEIVDLKKKINSMALQIQELTEQSAQRQRTIDQNIKTIKDLNAQKDELTQNFAKFKEESNKKEQSLNQTISELNDKTTQLLSKQEQLNTEVNDLQNELSQVNSNNQELTEGIDLINKERESEKQEYELKLQEYLTNIDQLNEQIQSHTATIEELQNQIQTLCQNDKGEELVRLNKVIKEMTAKENYLQEDIRTYKRKITSLESKNEDKQIIEDQVTNLQQANEELQNQIEQLKLRNKELEEELYNLQDKSFTSEKELSMIKERIPLVDEEMKNLIDMNEQNQIKINQLKGLLLQMESKSLIQEKKIAEQNEELEQKQVLVQMLKVELEHIDDLHKESVLHEKAFNVKKQEEYEKTIFNLIQENQQLQFQRQTLNTSINYLNKIDNFFDADLNNSQQTDPKILLQKSNKKIKVLVSELETQLKEKQILSTRVNELETYINLIIQNSVEYNSNNDKKLVELQSALFNNNNNRNLNYDSNLNSVQTFKINLQSPHNNNQTIQNQYDTNEVI